MATAVAAGGDDTMRRLGLIKETGGGACVIEKWAGI